MIVVLVLVIVVLVLALVSAGVVRVGAGVCWWSSVCVGVVGVGVGKCWCCWWRGCCWCFGDGVGAVLCWCWSLYWYWRLAPMLLSRSVLVLAAVVDVLVGIDVDAGADVGLAFSPPQVLDDPDYSLVKALQTAQQNFVITDPTLPDNPIVFASQGFLELTGYTLDQVPILCTHIPLKLYANQVPCTWYDFYLDLLFLLLLVSGTAHFPMPRSLPCHWCLSGVCWASVRCLSDDACCE